MKNPTIIKLGPLWQIGVIACVLSWLAGCANVSHVFLYQDSTLGINGGVNPENNNVNLHIGYHRDFYLVAPKVATDGSTAYNAASTYGYSKIVINGLEVPDIDELVATGTAATMMAGSGSGTAIFTH
jgi:hypothetical protein